MKKREHKEEIIEFSSLGSDIQIRIRGNVKNKSELENSIRDFYRKKEKIFSRFDEKSELSFLNNNLLKFNSASCDIINLAKKSLEYYQKSQGYFDPRIIEALEEIGYKKSFVFFDFSEAKKGEKISLIETNLEQDLMIDRDKVFFRCRMDFSGLAKGYITDQAANFVRERGISNFLVDSGGDMRVLGRDRSGENWRISLEGFSEEKLLIELTDDFQGVATSGISRRKWEVGGKKFHHLINPKAADEFSFNLKSVTVVAKTTEEADIWAKVLFLMGKEKGLEFSENSNIRSLFLDYNGNIFLSSSMKNNLVKI